jgi:hypothetical protein
MRMLTLSKPGLLLRFLLPALIFLTCILITFTREFLLYPNTFATAITLDLTVTAPFAYYLVIRKSQISRLTVLRLFIAGIFLAGILLPNNSHSLLKVIKTWVSPMIELSIVALLVKRSYITNKRLRASNAPTPDFLIHCRVMMTAICGSEKIASVLASECAVFYYIFTNNKQPVPGNSTAFTYHKENGILLIIPIFISLFIIETIALHFLLLQWNRRAAWVLTGLSLYSCLQLFAHMKAIKARPILLAENGIQLRNGLLGGDAVIDIENIRKVEIIKKSQQTGNVVKLSLFKGLENNNIQLQLVHPIKVIKAFGITRKANIIQFKVDDAQAFKSRLERGM